MVDRAVVRSFLRDAVAIGSVDAQITAVRVLGDYLSEHDVPYARFLSGSGSFSATQKSVVLDWVDPNVRLVAVNRCGLVLQNQAELSYHDALSDCQRLLKRDAAQPRTVWLLGRQLLCLAGETLSSYDMRTGEHTATSLALQVHVRGESAVVQDRVALHACNPHTLEREASWLLPGNDDQVVKPANMSSARNLFIVQPARNDQCRLVDVAHGVVLRPRERIRHVAGAEQYLAAVQRHGASFADRVVLYAQTSAGIRELQTWDGSAGPCVNSCADVLCVSEEGHVASTHSSDSDPSYAPVVFVYARDGACLLRCPRGSGYPYLFFARRGRFVICTDQSADVNRLEVIELATCKTVYSSPLVKDETTKLLSDGGPEGAPLILLSHVVGRRLRLHFISV